MSKKSRRRARAAQAAKAEVARLLGFPQPQQQPHQRPQKRMVTGVGAVQCPHCNVPTQRLEHPPEWRPPNPEKCFYAFWDKCPKCGFIKHYPEALRAPTGNSRNARRKAAFVEQQARAGARREEVNAALADGNVVWGNRTTWDDVERQAEQLELELAGGADNA
jgi:hypothetical protein